MRTLKLVSSLALLAALALAFWPQAPVVAAPTPTCGECIGGRFSYTWDVCDTNQPHLDCSWCMSCEGGTRGPLSPTPFKAPAPGS